MLRSLEQFDDWMSSLLRRWSSQLAGGPHQAEALEIRRDVLTRLRNTIVARGEGKYVFPYHQVAVELYAEDSDQAARLDAAFVDDDSLAAEIRELLAPLKSKAAVRVAVLEQAGAPEPFRLKLSRDRAEEAKPAERSGARPAASITVIQGSEPRQVEITQGYTRIGRLKEVLDSSLQLTRRNDLAFDDSETSVSRNHATIRWDEETSSYRLTDDGSVLGTSVWRDGRQYPVAKGEPLGFRLRDRDEIHIGSIRLRFEQE